MTHTESYLLNSDQRLLKGKAAARCFVTKLRRLGFNNEESLDLLKVALSKDPFAQNNRSVRSASGSDLRIKRSQVAIRQIMTFGLTESDIAFEANVTPGTIAHILAPHDGRSVSEALTVKLESLVPSIRILATCNSKDAAVDGSPHGELSKMVPVALRGGMDQVRFPKGIRAFLAAVGSTFHPVYLIMLSEPLTKQRTHLEALKHEIEHHMVGFIDDLILQCKGPEKSSSKPPSGGAIA